MEASSAVCLWNELTVTVYCLLTEEEKSCKFDEFQRSCEKDRFEMWNCSQVENSVCRLPCFVCLHYQFVAPPPPHLPLSLSLTLSLYFYSYLFFLYLYFSIFLLLPPPITLSSFLHLSIFISIYLFFLSLFIFIPLSLSSYHWPPHPSIEFANWNKTLVVSFVSFSACLFGLCLWPLSIQGAIRM